MKKAKTYLKNGLFLGLLAVACTSGLGVFHPAEATAAAGINQEMNFQGRLLDSTGAVIPDGNYNMEFKIVDGGDGCSPTSGTFPCSGTVKWTETRTSTDKVRVANGYFSVELGSVTSLPSNIWNSDTMWLSINIGGTGGSPSWDGEMKPLKRLTASPYAFNSAQLGGLTAANFVQLAQGLQADSSTTNASIAINKTGGTADILNLQRAGATVLQVANDGSALFQNQTDSGTAFQIQNAAGTSNLFVADTTDNFIGIGTAAPTHTLDVAVNNSSTNNLPVLIEQAGVGDSGLEVKNGSLSYYVGIDSSDGNAFKISSSSASGGQAVMGFNTTAGILDSGSQNVVGMTKVTASLSGTVSTLNVYINGTGSGGSKAQAAIYADSGGGPAGSPLGISNEITLPNGNAWNTFTFSTPVSVTATTTYWLANTTNGANNEYYTPGSSGDSCFKSFTYVTGTMPNGSSCTSTGSHKDMYAVIDATSSTDNLGSGLLRISDSGQVLFQNSADSTTAFQVQDASGVSLLNADTTNDLVTIGNLQSNVATGNVTVYTYPGGSFNVTDGTYGFHLTVDGSHNSNLTADQALYVNSGSGGIFIGTQNAAPIAIGSASTDETTTIRGSVLAKSVTNSSTAFQIQNSSSVSLLTADTSNMKVEVNGNIYSKGLSWTSHTPAAKFWDAVIYGNGLFVATDESFSGNTVATSSDGVNWASHTSAAGNVWDSITYGNGLFVAVSSSGVTNSVMTSPDGITWTLRGTPTSNYWKSVTYGNGLFVAVGNTGTGNRVMTSPDGVNWTLRSSAADNNWNSVTYGNGLFVAVSSSGTGNRVMTSPDGVNWTSRTSAADSTWTSITYGNGLFVAVSSSGVMTSPDGTTWTSRSIPAANSWNSVTYGNGLFVAVSSTGTGNRVMTSSDGVNWTLRSSAADNSWEAVTYGNGLFVAVADGGTNRVMTSGAIDLSVAPLNNIYQGGETVYGNSTFKSDSNSTTALQVQNSGGSNLFIIDTTTTNLVANPSLEVDTAGWSTSGSGTGLAISRTTTAANVYSGGAALQVVTASSASNTGASVTSFTSTLTPGTYTLSFDARASASFSTFDVTVTGGSTPTCLTGQTLTTSFQRFSCTFTSTSTNVTAINFVTSTSTQRTFYLDAIQLLSSNTNTTYNNGTVQLNGIISSPSVFKNSSDSTAALQIQNAGGVSILGVDTANKAVILGTAGSGGADGTLLFNNATNSNSVTLKSGATSSSYALTLPTALPGSTECLQSNTSGVLSWTSCGGGGGSGSLQDAYNLSSYPSITLDDGLGGVVISDSGDGVYGNLFAVQDNSLSANYLSVSSAGIYTDYDVAAMGNINSLAGDIQTGGTSRIDNSGNLLNVGTITGTGAIQLSATGSSHGVAIKNGSNYAGAFQVQNTSGYSVLGVDTSAQQVILGSAGSGGIDGSLVFNNGTTTHTATLLSGATTASYTLTLPTALPGSTECLQSSSSGVLSFTTCGGGGGSGSLQDAYNASSWPQLTLDSGFGGLVVTDSRFSDISGPLFAVQDYFGSLNYLSVDSNGIYSDESIQAVGDVGSYSGNLISGGTARIDYAGNLINIGNLTATGAIQIAATGSSNGVTIENGSDSTAGFSVKNTGSKSVITVDTTNKTLILGNSSTGGIDGGLVFDNATNSNTATIKSGATSTSYTLTLPTALPGSTQCLQSTSSGALSFTSCGGGGSTDLATAYTNSTAPATITLNTTQGGLSIVDGSTAVSGDLFAIKSNATAGSGKLFSVSTSTINFQDSAGNNGLSFDSSNSVLKIYENVSSPSNYAQIYYASGEAVFAASSGVTRIGAGSGNITMALTGIGDGLSFTKTATASSAYTAKDFTITRALTQGSNSSSGSAILRVEDTSTATSASNLSADILQLSQSNASATGNLINALTGGSTKFAVTAGGAVSSSGSITVGSGQSFTGSGAVTLSSAASTALTITGNAASTWSTSAGAITMQGAGGINLTAGSTNNITVGTADSTGTLLVLDTKNDNATDPTGVNGGMYYNSVAGAFRCYENSTWKNCISPWTEIKKGSDQDVTNNATPQDDTALQFSVSANTRYTVKFNLIYSGSDTAGDYRWRFNCPSIAASAGSAANGYYQTLSNAEAAVATATGAIGSTAGLWPAADNTPGASVVTTPHPIIGEFSIAVGATGGTCKLQFGNSAAAAGRISRTWAGSTIEYQTQ